VTTPDDALREHFRKGTVLDLAGQEKREIRARTIREILLDTPRTGNPPRAALRLRGATIAGALNLDGARVDAHLHLTACDLPDSATFSNARTHSLTFDNCTINGLVLRSTTVEGTVSIEGTRLTTANGADHALHGNMLTITGSFHCEYAQILGQISLVRARIGSELVLDGARLRHPGKVALNGLELDVGTSVLCQDGFHAEGHLSLRYAKIGGALWFSGATLKNTSNKALCLDGATVEKDIWLNDRFSADGDVSLIGTEAKQDLFLQNAECIGTFDLSYAKIGGTLRCNESRFHNPRGIALRTDGMSIHRDLVLDDVSVGGRASLIGTEVRQDLSLDRARLHSPGSLNAHSLRVGMNLSLRSFQAEGKIELIEAQAMQLDDSNTTWPETINLNGFTYTTLFPEHPLLRRLDWLHKNAPFRAQPYEQLARFYRMLGNDAAARRVLLAKEQEITKHSPWQHRPIRLLLEFLVGYGYLPGRATWWVLAALLLGTATFSLCPPLPVQPGTILPKFDPFAYTVSLLLPTVTMGFESNWIPNGAALVITIALKIMGWIVSIAVVASLTRMLSRN
jgi:hypothetical protein